MATGDITVFGLVSGIHVIEDIGMSVPHGHTITIPGEKANKSKDLWRAIGQKSLCLIQSGPFAQRTVNVTPAGYSQVSADKALIDRQQLLEDENRQLREAVERQRQEARMAETLQQEKLDSILKLLQAGIPMSANHIPSGVPASAPGPSIPPSDDAPTFIPKMIRPENAETRIDAHKTESDSTLGGASDKLRELRRRKP